MDKIVPLPEAQEVRVVTTIGHVDHGKTTFVDYLLAANNIISSRSAGKVRYMDSREDEQQRGITMESSSVSLRFTLLKKDPNGGDVHKVYTINLIDTPGHVDFSGEVSAASRLCDGALLLLDAVEGVCTQTIAVLQQSWQDRVRPILVINKIDRLVLELKLTPEEAYQHILRLLEQVNAVIGSFYSGERMEDNFRWREEQERTVAESQLLNNDPVTQEDEFQEKDDEDLYFAPERGNVIFASALDGWGFRIGHFAQVYAAKLGIKEQLLRRVLWGDYYLDPKTKRVIGQKHLRGRPLKPMFVQFVLDNIWAVYGAIMMKPDPDKIVKIIGTLGLKVSPRDLKSKDTRHTLSLVLGQWLSLSTCTIQAVIDVIPSPADAQRIRMPKMLYPNQNDDLKEPKGKLEKDLFSCDSSSDAYIVAFVSKMFVVSRKDLPQHKRKPFIPRRPIERQRSTVSEVAATDSLDPDGSNEETPQPDDVTHGGDDPCLLGFARLYSGVIKVGDSVCCILPKFNTGLGILHPDNSKHVVNAQVEALYVMMGRELHAAESISAGNVFAIQGLEGKVWRNATLCSSRGLQSGEDLGEDAIVNLGGVNRKNAPIVRVAIESKEPADMPHVIRGLQILNQSDPSVEVFQQQTGEHVILTAGELHLERCLKDLRERFANVELQVSKPIVPFRETAVKDGGDDTLPKAPSNTRGRVHGASAHSAVKFTIRALPLPVEIVTFLNQNVGSLNDLHKGREGNDEFASNGVDIHSDELQEVITSGSHTSTDAETFWEKFGEVCKLAGTRWESLPDKLWAFGPQNIWGCLLIDSRDGPNRNSFKDHSSIDTPDNNSFRLRRDLESSLRTGFQISTSRGPLCAEPVEGLAYFVESIEFNEEALKSENVQSRIAQVKGSLITAVKEACQEALLQWSPRLMLAMYTCDIQTSTDVLGKVYGVISKRRGKIVSEEMREGTSFFSIHARLPVVESFGFADDIRSRTSGAASPQLIFSGFELFDEDPFWVPRTEEELEDLGDKSDRVNVAKGYMDAVRERKGMLVDRKIVEFAEKQRTLKR